MKIIKKGNKKEEKENKFYKVKCDKCDTEFICGDSDVQELVERCEIYKDVYESQMKGAEELNA